MIDVAKWSFAVGHVFNDLCASMWFSFTLPYFIKVLSFDHAIAGLIVFIGQLCDAIATPLIGMESDRKGFVCGSKIGQRKSWHLLGTVLTVISFPFIFSSIFTPSTTNQWYMLVYYAPFVAVFQFAWAMVQVTHLSLIPIMVQEGEDNSTLNSLRYMFTIAANVVVLVATTFLFHFLPFEGPNRNQSTIHPSTVTINPHDKNAFTYISIGIVITGCLFSLIFHLGVHEISNGNIENCGDNDDKNVSELTSLMRSSVAHMSRSDWFKEPQFYLVNILYLSARLINNISQVYLIMYVTDTLGMAKLYGPLATLTLYLSGAIASIIVKRIQQLISKKICIVTGLIFISAYVVMVSFSHYHLPYWQMFLSMSILGIGSSIIMIGSLSITADLIGKSCSSSAFVYGCMSFSDKLSSGIVIQALQYFGPQENECTKCREFYKNIQLYFIGACVVLAAVILVILYPMAIGTRRRDLNVQNSVNSLNNEST